MFTECAGVGFAAAVSSPVQNNGGTAQSIACRRLSGSVVHRQGSRLDDELADQVPVEGEPVVQISHSARKVPLQALGDVDLRGVVGGGGAGECGGEGVLAAGASLGLTIEFSALFVGRAHGPELQSGATEWGCLRSSAWMARRDGGGRRSVRQTRRRMHTKSTKGISSVLRRHMEKLTRPPRPGYDGDPAGEERGGGNSNGAGDVGHQ